MVKNLFYLRESFTDKQKAYKSMSKFFNIMIGPVQLGPKTGDACNPLTRTIEFRIDPSLQVVIDQIMVRGGGSASCGFRMVKSNQPKSTRAMQFGVPLYFPQNWFPNTKYVPMETAWKGNPLAMILFGPMYDYCYAMGKNLFLLQDPLYIYPEENIDILFFNNATTDQGFGIGLWGHHEPVGTPEGRVPDI